MSDKGAVRRVVWWLALLAVIAVAVPVAARATGFEAGPLALLVAFMPWVTLGALVALVLAAFARSWTLVAAATVLTVLCGYWIAPLFVGGGGGGEPAVTIASLNVTVGGADANAVVDMVREHDVDILVITELTAEALDELGEAGLDGVLSHSATQPEPGVLGTGLWSRYQISDVKDLPGFTAHTLAARVAIPGQMATVFAVHPWPPGVGDDDRWVADLARLHDALAAAEGPVLVAGDFNTTRDHKGFRELEELGYVDAADRIDAGFQPTFPENRLPLPLVAIDHIMTRDVTLRPASFATLAIPGADHRALVVAYAASGGP